MRSTPTIGLSSALAALAATLTGTLASPAHASPWIQTFKLGDLYFPQHTTAFGDDPVLNITIHPVVVGLPLRFIDIEFDYDEADANGDPALDASWASDLGMVFTFDDGSFPMPSVGFAGSFRHLGALAGSYTLADALAAVDLFELWTFDGSQSNAPGPYSMFFTGVVPEIITYPETVTIDLTDTWDGNTIYRNFTVTLYFIPGPGGLALFGAGVMLAARRRRSRPCA